jgi:hypothetical protein
MFYETKIAVKKAFTLSKMLFGLGQGKYEELLAIATAIKQPTLEELLPYVESGYSREDAIVIELQTRYKKAAILAGLPEEYGLAMLEYAALERESR